MAKVVIGSITLRSGFSSEWNRLQPEGDSLWSGYVLLPGEIGIEKVSTTNTLEDPYLMKIGDGNTAWSNLPYVGASASEGYLSTDSIAVDNNRKIINLICSNLESNAATITSDGLYVRDRKVRVYEPGYDYEPGDLILSEDMTLIGMSSEFFTSSTWNIDVNNGFIRLYTPIFAQENIEVNTQTLKVYVKQDTGRDNEETLGTKEDPYLTIPYAVAAVRKRMLGKNVSLRIILQAKDDGSEAFYSLVPSPIDSYQNDKEYFTFKDTYSIEGEDKNTVYLKDVYLGEADLEISNVSVSTSMVSNIPAIPTLVSSKITFKDCIILGDQNLDTSLGNSLIDINSSYVIFDNCTLQNVLTNGMLSFVKAQGSVLVFHNTDIGGQRIADGCPIINNIDTLVILNNYWKNEYIGPTATHGYLADSVVSNEDTIIGTPYKYIRRYQVDQESSWTMDLILEQKDVKYKTTEFNDKDEVTPVAFKPKLSNKIRQLNGEKFRKYYYIGPPSDGSTGYTMAAVSPRGEEHISSGDGEKDGIEWVAKTPYQKSRVYSEPNPEEGQAAHFLDKPAREQVQQNDFYVNEFAENSDISALARVSDTFNAFGTPFSKTTPNNITQGYIIKFNAMKKPKIRFHRDSSGNYTENFAASALKFGGKGEAQYLGWHTRNNSNVSMDLVFSIFTIRNGEIIDLDLIYDSSANPNWQKEEIKLHRPIEGSVNDAQLLGGYDDLAEGIKFPILWANIGYVIVTSGEKIPYISPSVISADYVVDKNNRYGFVTAVMPNSYITVEVAGVSPSMANTARYVMDNSEELPTSGEREISWNMFELNNVYDGLGYEKLPVTGEYSETYQINIQDAHKVETREQCTLKDLPDIEYIKILNPEDKIVGEAIVAKKQYGLPILQITPTQFENSFDAYDVLDGGNLD